MQLGTMVGSAEAAENIFAEIPFLGQWVLVARGQRNFHKRRVSEREREKEGSVYEMAPGRGFNSRRARFLSRRLRSITIYLVLLIAFFLFTLIYISRKGLEGVGQKGTSSEEVRSERVCFLLALAYSGSYSLMGCRQVVILISWISILLAGSCSSWTVIDWDVLNLIYLLVG